jgi:Domain of unknown function (DUF4062)
MSTGKIYKVFVSSTYEDLREERAEIQKTLLQMDCIPVGMELFPASNEETWNFIQGQIDDSDYYLVLIGGKYGSLTGSGISFTEQEYDYAQLRGKPSLGFIHANPDALPLNKSEKRSKSKAQLRAFIDKVSKRPIKKFSSPHELSAAVALSMRELIHYRPATGFVRANAPSAMNAFPSPAGAKRTLISLSECVTEVLDIVQNTTSEEVLEIEQIGLDMSYAWGLISSLFRANSNIRQMRYSLLMLTDDAEAIDPRYEEVRRWCHTVKDSSKEAVASEVKKLKDEMVRSGRSLDVVLRTYSELPFFHGIRIIRPFKVCYMAVCRWGGERYDEFLWGGSNYHRIIGMPEDAAQQDLLQIFEGQFGHLWSVAGSRV